MIFSVGRHGKYGYIPIYSIAGHEGKRKKLLDKYLIIKYYKDRKSLCNKQKDGI